MSQGLSNAGSKTFLDPDTGKPHHTRHTYTLLAVKDIAQVLIGLGIFADESEDPLVRLIVGAE